MKDSLEDSIDQTYTDLTRVRIAAKQLVQVKNQISELEEKQSRLHDKMQKEHRDVVALEEKNLRNIFSGILGNRNQELEIERQEYLQALLSYRSISDELQLAVFEHDVLQNQVLKLPKLEQEMSKLLQLMEQKLRHLNPDISKKIKDYNTIIDLKKSRVIEIKEALDIGEQLKNQLELILKDLRNVRNFGNQGLMHGKGKYSSYKKKTYIDHSQKKALKINALLHRFEQELEDIYKEFDANFHMDEFERFIDSFYDHLITDWIIQQQLNSAISSSVSVATKVSRLIVMVQAEAKAEKKRIEELIQEKRDLVLQNSKTTNK